MFVSALAAAPLLFVAQVAPAEDRMSAPFVSAAEIASETTGISFFAEVAEAGAGADAALSETSARQVVSGTDLPEVPTRQFPALAQLSPQTGPGALPEPVPMEDQADSDIVVTARQGDTPSDPIAGVNKVSFGATQAVDRALIAPLAHAYEHAIPRPLRDGLRNALNNLLDEPIVFLNFLLLLKPGKAAETLARFAINSTIGIGGVLDIAKRRPFHLPRRQVGFADTLACYGVGPGPFLFLPLVGPTTVRDILGGAIDGLVLPTLVGKPFTQVKFTGPTAVLHELDSRVAFDDELETINNSPDPYLARRASYLRTQQAQIDALHCGHHRRTTPAPGQRGPDPSIPPQAALQVSVQAALQTAPSPADPAASLPESEPTSLAVPLRETVEAL